MLTPLQQDFLRRAARAAVAAEHATGLPAELPLAQACLESSWGARAPANNCLGIKAALRHAQTQEFDTHEVVGGKTVAAKLRFAAYSSMHDCFADHALLLTTAGAYRRAWMQYQTDHDLQALIDGIARKYATDPAYAAKVRSIAARPDVQAALAEARRPAERNL